jgi:hypothetical protein
MGLWGAWPGLRSGQSPEPRPSASRTDAVPTPRVAVALPGGAAGLCGAAFAILALPVALLAQTAARAQTPGETIYVDAPPPPDAEALTLAHTFQLLGIHDLSGLALRPGTNELYAVNNDDSAHLYRVKLPQPAVWLLMPDLPTEPVPIAGLEGAMSKYGYLDPEGLAFGPGGTLWVSMEHGCANTSPTAPAADAATPAGLAPRMAAFPVNFAPKTGALSTDPAKFVHVGACGESGPMPDLGKKNAWFEGIAWLPRARGLLLAKERHTPALATGDGNARLIVGDQLCTLLGEPKAACAEKGGEGASEKYTTGDVQIGDMAAWSMDGYEYLAILNRNGARIHLLRRTNPALEFTQVARFAFTLPKASRGRAEALLPLIGPNGQLTFIIAPDMEGPDTPVYVFDPVRLAR